MKQIVYLSLTPERWAAARGTATPEQRKIAKKQRCFIVLEEPYYPTVGDMKEALATIRPATYRLTDDRKGPVAPRTPGSPTTAT